MKVFKFYVLIMTIFLGKGGILFKGGHYSRKYGTCLFSKFKYRITLNNVLPYIMSSLEYYPPFFPKYSHNQYIRFENLQIMSPSEDVKIINVLGHYLRKYSIFLGKGGIVFKGGHYLRKYGMSNLSL